MSPRPRLLADSAILAAAAHVVSRTGPERFTLADVGQEVGLSAATLVQRFGSKRRLLLLMHQQTAEALDGRLNAVTASADGSPLEALYSAALNRVDSDHEPPNVANFMAFMLQEVSDPDFQAVSAANAKNAVEGYKSLLEKAINAGELRRDGVGTQALAEAIHSLTLGSMMTSAILHDTSNKTRIARDLDALLRPYRVNGDGADGDGQREGPRSETSAPSRAD